MLGKTFKGLTDAMLTWQTERLLALETRRDGAPSCTSARSSSSRSPSTASSAARATRAASRCASRACCGTGPTSAPTRPTRSTACARSTTHMTRRTNLALAVVLGAATATGVLALLVGEGRVALVVWAHGAAGLAALALVRPKSRIAVRGTVRRGRAAAPGLLLGGLVTVSMGLGIAHATGVGALGPLTALGWHIGLALAAVPVAAAHVWRRPPRPRTGDLTRAAFLRAAGIAAAGVAAKLAFERLAGAPRAATGSLPAPRPFPRRGSTTRLRARSERRSRPSGSRRCGRQRSSARSTARRGGTAETAGRASR